MRRVIIYIVILLQCAVVSGASKEAFSDLISKRFVEYYATGGGIQEKLYLTTDKPYYSAGDTIYFSAFLINSIYFERTTDSKFIYVELVNAMGDVVSRLKVLGEDGRFNNAIPLPTRITAGRYTLRAYTRWQTNFDIGYIFAKEITIGNYIDDTIQTNFSYEFDGDGRVRATVEVTNNTYTPVTDRPINYTLRINGQSHHRIVVTDKQGKFHFSFRPTNDDTDCIRLNINANGRKLDRVIQLPSFKEDFSVRFMPEGGNLIADIEQVVAFRAVGRDGHPVDIQGVVTTKSGEEVAKIASQHDGMGKFSMKANVNEQYIAKVSTPNGISRTFTLPAVQASGCVIRLNTDGDKRAVVRILTTPDIERSNYAIIVQSRGVVDYVVEDISNTMRISLDKLRSGVAILSVVDKTLGKVVAERLFFAQGECANISIMPSAGYISPHSKLTLDFQLLNSKGDTVRGDFVVSVVDDGVIKPDLHTDNIFTYLLLNSDLRGKIENPQYYFDYTNSERNEHLDLVMLTHGWRRYNLNSLLAGEKAKVKYLPEKMQSITGRIMGLSGKARNASVMIYRNRKEYLGVHPLNKTNRFEISGIDAPDTTKYLLQALNRDGESSRMRIKIDPLIYPVTPVIERTLYTKGVPFSSISEEYMMRAKRNYYNDGGERIIDIEEVVVTAKRIYNYDYTPALDDYNTISGDMTRFVSVFDALQRFRKLEISGNSVTLRGKHITPPEMNVDEENLMLPPSDEEVEERVPQVYVNGQEMDINALDAYPMSEITSISFLDKEESLTAGLGGQYGTIILQVKDINARQQYLINSMAEVIVPGYAPPVEFYTPDYSVIEREKKPDLRTTIAWYPLVKSDALGRSSVSFYTASRSSNYRVIVEGITSEGELMRNEMIIPAR